MFHHCDALCCFTQTWLQIKKKVENKKEKTKKLREKKLRENINKKKWLAGCDYIIFFPQKLDQNLFFFFYPFHRLK